MKAIAFKFTVPGKKPEDASKSADKEPDTKDSAESDEKDEAAPTREELGRDFIRAYRSGDGEAVVEAVLRINEYGRDAE